MNQSSGAFIVHNQKVLLMLRDDYDHISNPNTWAIIGGAIEKGETPLEAMKREMEEEIVLVPQNIQFIGRLITKYGVTHGYVAYITDDESKVIKLQDEGQELRFFSWNDLLIEPKLVPEMKYLIKKFPEVIQVLFRRDIVTALKRHYY